MSATADALRAKTDAELLFFVQNPAYYQAELVEAARRELRRRGVAMAPTLPTEAASAAPEPNLLPARPARPWAWLVAAGLGLGVAGWWWQAQRATPAPATARPRPGRLLPDSLKLTEAVAAPLPSFDAEQHVSRQLALVPAAEQAQASAQALRQYRGLALRFWRAQNPSVYLIAQAQRAHPGPVLLAQLHLVQEQWNDFGRGAVYSYAFPPTMADQLARMRVIARLQRATLTEIAVLQNQLPGNDPLPLPPKARLAQDTARHLARPLQQLVKLSVGG